MNETIQQALFEYLEAVEAATKKLKQKIAEQLQQIYGLTEEADTPFPEKVQKVQENRKEDTFFSHCFLCQKSLPDDLAHCTYLDGKPIHLSCYRKLKTQEINFSKGTQQDFEAITKTQNPSLSDQEVEKLFEKLVDEGQIAMDQEGWWRWTT